MRRKIIAMILIFIAPAVAVAGFVGIDKAIQPLRDAPLELTLGEAELIALDEYFGHIEDASYPPETSARVDIAWNEMYVHVTACMYGKPAEFVNLEQTGENTWYAVIRIKDEFTSDRPDHISDAARMFDDICSRDGVTLEVLGKSVPSEINPMNYEWTQRLVSYTWKDMLAYQRELEHKRQGQATVNAGLEKDDILKATWERIVDALWGNPASLLSLERTGDSGEASGWYAVIEIGGWMTDGTDICCQKAAEVFHAVCSIPGVVLEVRGDFVPSAVNPMDVRWTGYILEVDGYEEYSGMRRSRVMQTEV